VKLGTALKESALMACILFACNFALFAQGNGFNTEGNVLIADQFNNRVIEVDLQGDIVWHTAWAQPISRRRPSLAPMMPSASGSLL
jgi:hypothetical protein